LVDKNLYQDARAGTNFNSFEGTEPAILEMASQETDRYHIKKDKKP